MKFNINTGTELTGENLVCPFISDEHLAENLRKVGEITGYDQELLNREFKAEAKECLTLFRRDNGGKVFLLGLGNRPGSKDVIGIVRSFFYQKRYSLKGVTDIDLRPGELAGLTEFFANGAGLASYRLGARKTDTGEKADYFSPEAVIRIVVSPDKEESAAKAAGEGSATAQMQIEVMGLVDAPSNDKTPEIMAAYAVESGKKYGFNVTVLDEKACESAGLHALLAVGKGSVEHPPCFLVLEYKGAEEKEVIGLVGKGVTFDTGGVSLKPGDNMNYMKSDMGGAGAVLGIIGLAARLQWPVNLAGVIPVTENCIDGLAIKPGDVIGSYAGKSIEVINTDAEGRLILADGLAYLNKNFKPAVMIDLATLTGNCIMALGYAAAALLSNHDELAGQLLEAGRSSGEKTWRMPLWDDYKDMMKSDVADIKNLSSAPVAGAITAAKFLEAFIDGHPRWAHLDIAGVAFGDSEFGSMKSATAYGIRLLKDWILKNYL